MILADDFLQRNPWVPGVVAAVVLFLIATAINFYLRQRDKESKTFDYRVVSDIPIFFGPNRPADLKVMHFGLEVANPRITRIRFENTGKRVIEETDFLEPYEIKRGSAEIVDYNIVEQSEHNLAAVHEIAVGEPQSIKILPKTLNPGDWFILQLVYDCGASENVSIAGRIKGQTRKSAIYPTDTEFWEINSTPSVIMTFGIIPLFLGIVIYFVGIPPNRHQIGLLIFALGVVVILSGFILRARNKRRVYARLRGEPKPPKDS